MLKSMIGSPVGQFALAGLVVVAIAAIGKLYYVEKTKPLQEVKSEEVQDRLEAAAEALQDYAERQPEGASPYPAPSSWVPAGLSCGREAVATPQEASQPVWKVLALAVDKPGRYQFRFSVKGDTFELLARSDFDCDGLHQVYRQSGQMGLTGLNIERLTVDNPKE